MSLPQVQQRPAALNGVGRRRADRDVGNTRADTGFRSDSQNWRSSQASSRSGVNASTASSGHHSSSSGSNRGSAGERLEPSGTNVSRGAGVERPIDVRLQFMAMCLIGQPVEVQVKNGSFYSGIFHTADVGKDFGLLAVHTVALHHIFIVQRTCFSAIVV
jgi:hypothetical protein